MDIGFVASGTPQAVLERATRLGFDGVELCFGWGEPCDLERWTADDTKRVQDLMAETGARVLTVAYEKQAEGIKPFTSDIFKGFLAVFLLDMGIIDNHNQQDAFIQGLTFGVEINR